MLLSTLRLIFTLDSHAVERLPNEDKGDAAETYRKPHSKRLPTLHLL